MLQTKRKHFVIDDKLTSNKRETLEWMRINTERDRIQRYKGIIHESASFYYTCIEEFSKLMERRKE
jgi:hypothetical protein